MNVLRECIVLISITRRVFWWVQSNLCLAFSLLVLRFVGKSVFGQGAATGAIFL